MAFEDPSRHPLVVGVDLAAASATLATFFDWLPKFVVVVSAIWFLIQIWESTTVQKLVAAWRVKHRMRRHQRLIANAKRIAALLAAVELVDHAKVDAVAMVGHARAEAVALVAADKAAS